MQPTTVAADIAIPPTPTLLSLKAVNMQPFVGQGQYFVPAQNRFSLDDYVQCCVPEHKCFSLYNKRQYMPLEQRSMGVYRAIFLWECSTVGMQSIGLQLGNGFHGLYHV